MNEPVNIVMVLLLIVIEAGYVGIAYSPDAMDALARRLRARASATRASREHWRLAYRESLHNDLASDSRRVDFNRLVGPE